MTVRISEKAVARGSVTKATEKSVSNLKKMTSFGKQNSEFMFRH